MAATIATTSACALTGGQMNILDPKFIYRNAASTNIAETWRKHGFVKTTQAERNARKKPKPMPANVRAMPLRKGAAK